MVNDYMYIAFVSKARFLLLIQPLTHQWQWDSVQGVGPTIRSSVRFTVFCPKDMWTGG